MFTIRPKIFETNSSSSDYYNEGPSVDEVTVNQRIHVRLQYPDEYTDDDIYEATEKIVKAAMEDTDLLIPIYKLGDECSDDSIEADYDEICIYLAAYATIGYEGRYYPATRYEPEEYPEPVIEDATFLPEKGDFKGKEEAKEEFLKNLKNAGFTNVIKVLDIYGDPIDDSDYYDNI